MKRRKFRRRRAVSTVVANMLMILITISLAAILVAWAGTTYGSFTGGSQLFFLQRGQALQERFVIEATFFDKTNTQIMIFVRNVGVEQLSVVSIYVNGTQYTPKTWVLSPCSGNPDNSVTLVVGTGNANNVCEFKISIPSWSPGALFSVVVASARGNQATATSRGP